MVVIKDAKKHADIVTDMNRDIYMLEQDDIDQTNEMIEHEEYDMTYMHNDDDYDEDIEDLAIQLGAIRELE